MKDEHALIDTGYMLLHTSWIIDYLDSNDKIDINNEILFPLILFKFKGKHSCHLNFHELLKLESLLDYAIRNNDYSDLPFFIKPMYLKQYQSIDNECTKMLKDTFTDILTSNDIFSGEESTDTLINKLA